MPDDLINSVKDSQAQQGPPGPKPQEVSSGVKTVIEALLFASEKPLALSQIRGALDNLDADSVRAAVDELRLEYEKSQRGIRIYEVAGGFQMITSPELSPFLKKLYKGRLTERLSRPALETLAIIAYKQPITKFEIESLRNVNVDGVMKSLLEKNFIRICGRRKTPGRPFVFGTTAQFLEYFGLKSLEELPKMEDFSKLTTEAVDGPNEPEKKD